MFGKIFERRDAYLDNNRPHINHDLPVVYYQEQHAVIKQHVKRTLKITTTTTTKNNIRKGGRKKKAQYRFTKIFCVHFVHKISPIV